MRMADIGKEIEVITVTPEEVPASPEPATPETPAQPVEAPELVPA